MPNEILKQRVLTIKQNTNKSVKSIFLSQHLNLKQLVSISKSLLMLSGEVCNTRSYIGPNTNSCNGLA